MSKYIVTADWHLRKTPPRCRLEKEKEWLEFQFSLLLFILENCVRYKADLIIAGDIFDKAQPGIELINLCSDLLRTFFKEQGYKNKIIACAGNHDLPYHNFDNFWNSGFGTLLVHESIQDKNDKIDIEHFNTNKNNTKNMVICHHLVYEKEVPLYIEGMTAKETLEMYANANWIFCGDNHSGFHHEQNGRHVIVPGSIYIDSADRKKYKPCVWFVDTETEEIKQIFLPNPIEMITDNYLKKEKERNERLDSFVEIIKSKGAVSLSFIENLKKKLTLLSFNNEVKNLITEIQNELE
jgi:predicted phosphodiesterase